MKISPSGIVGKLTAGTNVTITGTPVNPTVNSSGGGGSGTVTSVSATAPATVSNPTTTPNIVVPVMVASGASHAAGLVPDPGVTGGITKFLREDATFAVPAGGGGGGSFPLAAAILTDPTLTSFVNQSNSPVITSGVKNVVINHPNIVLNNQLFSAKSNTNLPAAPWTVTAMVSIINASKTNAVLIAPGGGLFVSDGTKYAVMRTLSGTLSFPVAPGWLLVTENWATVSAAPAGWSTNAGSQTLQWFRFVNDGTNLTAFFSVDGVIWVQMSTQLLTVVNPTICGLCIVSDSGGVASTVVYNVCYSFQVTTP